jgi:hypothetical protein
MDWLSGNKRKILLNAALVILWTVGMYLFADRVMHGLPGKIRFKESVTSINIDSTRNTALIQTFMLYENNSDSRKKVKLFYPVYTDKEISFPKEVVFEEFRGNSGEVLCKFRTIELAAKNKDVFPELKFKQKEFTKSDVGVFSTLELEPGESSIFRAEYVQACKIDSYIGYFGTSSHIGFNFTTNAGWGHSIEKAVYMVSFDENTEITIMTLPGDSLRWWRSPLNSLENVKPGAEDSLMKYYNYRVYEATDHIDRGISVFYRRVSNVSK